MSNTSDITAIHIHQLANLIHLKLRDDNFITWKSLLMPVIRKFQILSFLDGSHVYPSQFTGRGTNQLENPLYVAWCDKDQTIILWIQSTVAEAVIPYFAGATSSHELWRNIESRFARTSTTHTIQLRTHLQGIKQGSKSVSVYLDEIKKISNELAATGSKISYDELFVVILGG
ncbi:uncharacterized protein LOC113328889 [Papaver somniferum]|uniref:uncharacterized protein LOC113328889 n=1 Tax=Papaver somniferum TaxID=3469 RepID=UPI000E6F7EED|nr:uncharacterized protein LOC113328889 [Papaver somniferum]